MKYFICLFLPLLLSCTGTLRTAKAIEKGKWAFEAGLGFGPYNNYPYYYPATLAIRRGISEGFDAGVRVVYPGLELLLYKQLLYEKPTLFSPSAGISIGLTFISCEVELIISKEISFISPYVAFEMMGVFKEKFLLGFNSGFEINVSKLIKKKSDRLSILTEYSYGYLYNFFLYHEERKIYKNPLFCLRYAF